MASNVNPAGLMFFLRVASCHGLAYPTSLIPFRLSCFYPIASLSCCFAVPLLHRPAASPSCCFAVPLPHRPVASPPCYFTVPSLWCPIAPPSCICSLTVLCLVSCISLSCVLCLVPGVSHLTPLSCILHLTILHLLMSDKLLVAHILEDLKLLFSLTSTGGFPALRILYGLLREQAAQVDGDFHQVCVEWASILSIDI